MPIDPVTGALIGAGVNFLGDLLGGGGPDQEAMARMDAQTRERIAQMQNRENMRQFNIDQYGGVLRQLEQLPMRDRISYLVSQRLGMAPGAFQPRDIYNPSTSAVTPQHGGIDMAAYQQAAGAYQPGMGGTEDAANAWRTIGADLGYTDRILEQPLGPNSRGVMPSRNFVPLNEVNAGMAPAGGAGGGNPFLDRMRLPLAAQRGGWMEGKDQEKRFPQIAQGRAIQQQSPWAAAPMGGNWMDEYRKKYLDADPTARWGG